MMEEFTSDDEFEPIDDRYSPTKEEENAFVNSIVGAAYNPEMKYNDTKTPERVNYHQPEKFKDIQVNYEKTAPTFETKGGKGIRVVKDEWGNLWHVEFTSGGTLPQELSGKFTDEKAAELAVRIYLAKE